MDTDVVCAFVVNLLCIIIDTNAVLCRQTFVSLKRRLHGLRSMPPALMLPKKRWWWRGGREAYRARDTASRTSSYSHIHLNESRVGLVQKPR